jgi:hypothetical protein
VPSQPSLELGVESPLPPLEYHCVVADQPGDKRPQAALLVPASQWAVKVEGDMGDGAPVGKGHPRALFGHQEARLWALPEPASQCLHQEEVKERRQRAALSGISLPDLAYAAVVMLHCTCAQMISPRTPGTH